MLGVDYMVFGDTLKMLLDFANIKQAHLASYLGYDVSYISRWLNGTKLPSLKNNSPLLALIAEYIIKNTNSTEHLALCKTLGAETVDSEDYLVELIVKLLKDSYQLDSEKPHLRHFSSTKWEYNSRVSWVSVSRSDVNRIMGELLSEATYQSDDIVRVFSMSGCDDFGYSECKRFWHPIIEGMKPGTTIHIDLLAPFWEHEYLSGVARDILIFLFGLGNSIETDIFARSHSYPDNYSLWVCNNTVCVEGSFDKFLNRYKTFFTQDKSLTSEYYGAGTEELRTKSKLIYRNSFESLYKAKFFQSFMMDGDICMLTNTMPIHFFGDELKSSLCAKYNFDHIFLEMNDFFEKMLGKWSIAVYRSAVINFFFEGKAYLFGHEVVLEPDERVIYLNNLIQRLERTQGELYILNDTNPVMNLYDVDCSLFLGGRSLFAVKTPDDKTVADRTIISANDSSLIKCFRYFFADIHSLSDTFVSKNEQAISILKQGIKLIQNK
jgi:transcriptional regulator with XRE-family HTH domain